jgi:hypothetical protein
LQEGSYFTNGQWETGKVALLKLSIVYTNRWLDSSPRISNIQMLEILLRNGAAVVSCSILLPSYLAGIRNKICEDSIKRKKYLFIFSSTALRE